MNPKYSDSSSPPKIPLRPRQPAASSAGKRHVNKHRLAIAVVVFIAVGLLPGLSLLVRTERGAPSPNTSAALQANVSRVSCGGEHKSYENSFMDMGFCYPRAWGEVFVEERKSSANDTGKRWRMMFTAQTHVAVGLVSRNWPSGAMQGASCADPAARTAPSFAFTTAEWKTEGYPIAGGSRYIEAKEGRFLIEESVADAAANGACLTGYVRLGNTYAAATYLAEFTPTIMSPELHMAQPNILIPEINRNEFVSFVKTIQKL